VDQDLASEKPQEKDIKEKGPDLEEIPHRDTRAARCRCRDGSLNVDSVILLVMNMRP
jgi:hypothetical protein